MGKLISTLGFALILFGLYNVVAGIVGVCIVVPMIILYLPGYIREKRIRDARNRDTERVLEESRQWMRDNGRENEINW